MQTERAWIPSSSLVDLLSDDQLRIIVRVAECGLGSGLEDINSLVVQEIASALAPEFCGLWRSYEEDERRLSLVSCHSGDMVSPFASQDVVPGSQAQYAMFSESEVVVEDLRAEDRFVPSRIIAGMGLVSGMMVPLVGTRRSHGYLDVYWRSHRRVNPSERAFLGMLGKIVSSSLDRAAGNEKIARESAQAQLLIEIGKVVSSSLQIETVYAKFAELVGCLIPFDRISLSLVNDVTGMSRTAYNSGLDLGLVDPGEEHPTAGTISGEVARLRKPVVVNSRNQFETAARLPRFRRYMDAGLSSTLSVPIFWHDRVIAVLTLRSLQKDIYGAEHVSIASRLAALIAGAVANAEMHSTLNQLAGERLLLTEISRGVNSAPNERAAFLRLANGIGQLMPIDRITLGMLDDDECAIRRRFVSGIPISGWEEGMVVSVTHSGAKGALALGHPVVFRPEEKLRAAPSQKSTAEAFLSVGIRSVMYVPLVYGGRAKGVISVCSRDPDSYGEREISLADRIASLVSGFLAAVKATDKLQRVQHQYDLAEALLEEAAPGETAIEFVARMEDRIAAAAICDLFLYCEREQASDELIVRFSGGTSSHLVRTGSVVASVALDGTVTAAEDLARDLSAAGILSSAWTPVSVKDRVVGAIGIFAYRHRSIGITKKRSMSLLANRLGRLVTASLQAELVVQEPVALAHSRLEWPGRELISDGRVASLVIVDAHPACRGTIRVQLAQGPFRVVGECRSIDDVQGAADGACDLIVWGIHSTDSPADIRAATRVSHLFKILVLTDRLSVDGLREILRTGIGGYLPRQTSPAALERDISTLLAGGTTIDPALLSVFFSKLPASQLGLTSVEEKLLAGMSERDRDLLRDVGYGKSNIAIAREMNLAVGSVKNRLVEIYRHIGAADRVEAAAFAMRAGLLK